MSAPRVLYTEIEKLTLMELVEEKRAILESKKTDAVSQAQKKKIWEGKAALYCLQLGTRPRTTEQLKVLWKNLVARAKKEKSTERKERLATGGGTLPQGIVSSISERVMAMTPGTFVPPANMLDEDHSADVNAEGTVCILKA